MTSKWLTTRADFGRLAPAWDAALASIAATGLGADNPFLLADFIRSWCEAFVPDGDLRILAVHDGARLVGGWPLYHADPRRAGIRWPMLRAVGIGFANLTEPFSTLPPAEFAQIALPALHQLPGWRYLNLPQSRTRWLAGAGVPYLQRAASTTARIRIDRDAAAYVRTLRPTLQTNLRRYHRLAAQAGGVRLVRETAPEAIAALIDFQLRHNGPDRYPADTVVTPSRAAWAKFTAEVLELFARSGKLDAMALRVNDEIAAVAFGFRFGAGFKGIVTAYDPRFRPLGPGFLLIYQLIDWCWQRQDPYLEMYGDGAEFAKRRWANEFDPLYRLRIFHPGAVGRGLYWVTRLCRG